MTVHDRLLELGARDREIRDAEVLIAGLLPLGRLIVLHDEVLMAARAGDAALVALLIAEEVDPHPSELVALQEAARLSDGTQATLQQVREGLRRGS